MAQDSPAVDATDRTLLARTFAALALFGLTGVMLARAINAILGAIAIPAWSQYLRPYRFDQEAAAIATRFADGDTRPALWLLCAAAAVACLAFPLLFNRHLSSRRLFSVAGLTKYLGLLLCMGLLETGVGLLSGLFTRANGPVFFGELPVLPGAGPDTLRWVVMLVGSSLIGAGFFVLFSERTLGSSPDKWERPANFGQEAPRAALLGALVGILQGLLAGALAGWFATLLQALFTFLGELAEISALGWQRLELGMGLGLGLLLAFSGALPVALAPGNASRGMKRAAVALALLPGVLLVISGLAFQRYAMVQGEMSQPTVVAAAGFSPAPTPRLMVIPSEAGPAEVVPYPLTTEVVGFSTNEPVGASLENVTKAQKYLEARGSRWTAHTIKALHAPAAIYDRLLQVEQALPAWVQATEKGGSLLWSTMLLARVGRMPASPAWRETANALLDERQFVAGGKSAAKLARLAARVGNMEKAKQLGALAEKEGYVRTTDEPAWDLPPVSDGIISGRVLLDGAPLAGARAALVSGESSLTGSASLQALKLCAAMDTNPDGTFQFNGILDGTWHVALLLPETLGDDPAKVTAQGSLGPAELKGPSASVVLGDLRIERHSTR